MTSRLLSLHIYPLKSTRGIAVPSASVERRGIEHDRRWMLVDEQGRFLSARRLPRMLLIEARTSADGLMLQAAGMPSRSVAIPAVDGPRQPVKVWDSLCSAARADRDSEAWLQQFLGMAVRLVYMDAACVRAADARYAQSGDTVSFADGYPLLLISQAALRQLNERLPAPVSMTRFRPNLVIEGCAAHAEDSWRRIRIGAVTFDVVKPCARCVLTTVVPERGERDPSGEPLATLRSYRSTGCDVYFGMNLIPRQLGCLSVGDVLEVLE